MTIVGSSEPVQLAPAFERDDQGRWTTTLRWRGLRDQLLDLASGFTTRARIIQEDSVWHLLEVSIAGLSTSETAPSPDEQIVTIYDLDYAGASFDLWLRPDVQEELKKIEDPAGRAQFKADLTALCKGERVVMKFNEGGRATQAELKLDDLLSVASTAGMDLAVIEPLADSLVSGDEELELEIPVVKVQRVAPPGSSIRADFGGLSKYIATPTMLARYPAMPPIIRENISGQLNNGFWKVLAPRVKTQDATRVVIEEAYEYKPKYNRWTYGNPLPA